jgi:hypothetical protein
VAQAQMGPIKMEDGVQGEAGTNGSDDTKVSQEQMDPTEHKVNQGRNGSDGGAQGRSRSNGLTEHKEKQEQMELMEHKVNQNKWN